MTTLNLILMMKFIFISGLGLYKKKGVIESIKYHPEPYQLFEPVKKQVADFKKTKTNIKEMELLKGAIYTADFIITFPAEWRHILFEYHDTIWTCKDPVFIVNRGEDGTPYCIIDVKGNVPDRFLKSDSNAKLSMTQKIMYEVHGLYVQKIICDKLFEKTFTPYDILNRKRTRLPKNLDTVHQFVEKIIEKSNYPIDKLCFI